MTSRVLRAAPAVALLLVAALYASSLQSTPFSDGVWLARRVEHGGAHYNALYLPLGHALHRSAGAFFGWDGHRSLVVFSALAGLLAAALLAGSLSRYRVPAAARALLVLVFACTPSVWFFATVAEVHALQLLAAAAATEMALRARAAAPRVALAWVLGAIVLSLAAHLTTALLVPALVLLALGPGPGRGLTPRTAGLLLVLGVLAVGAAFALAGDRMPLLPFQLIARAYWARISQGVLFGPAETTEFLWAEIVLPAGAFLPLALALAPLARRRRLALPALVAIAPYVLLLPQTGVREEGAYFLSVLPLLVHVVAAAVEELEARSVRRGTLLGMLGAAVAVQLAAGAARIAAHGREVDARDWARAAHEICPRGGVFVVASLPRQHAILEAHAGNAADDYRRRFELTPRTILAREMGERLGTLARNLKEGRRVLVDADMLLGDDRPAAFLQFEERLRRLPFVRLEARPEGAHPPLVFEILVER